MAAENWTAQLHIVDGVASEDAPEIAYAERRDHRGRLSSLYILAEPDRPGSEPFIGELVSRIGEEYLAGEGSLTGILQRVIRERHEELLDWNRTSLPRDQASYGLSCLVVREGDVFLMQMGPCLAYYRRDGRMLRRRPSSEEASAALGSAEATAPEFSQLVLDEDDWVLLISSEVTHAIGEEAIGSLRDGPAENVLAALYPKLRILPRVSALVVAPGAASAPAGAVQADPPAIEPVPDVAPAAEAPPPAAPAEAPSPDLLPTAAGSEADRYQADAGFPSGVAEADPQSVSSEGQVETWEDEAPDPFEEFPERTSVGAAVWGFFSGFGSLFRRKPPRDDHWAEAYSEDDFAIKGTRDAPAAVEWDRSPVSDPEVAAGDAEAKPPDREPIAASGVDADPTSPPLVEEPLAPTDVSTEPDADAITDASADDGSEDEDDGPMPPAGSPSESAGGEAGGPAGGIRGGVEYHIQHDDPPGPGTLEALAAGWPSNPFTTPSAPVLETGADADQARFPRSIFPLEGRMLRFRARRKGNAAESSEEPTAPRRGWGALALAVAAVVGMLAVVVGVLLIPDLLENSEQSRFEELVEEARRGLTAASLTSEAAASRVELTEAQTAIAEALDLRPLEESVLALQQEVQSALSQINAVVRPPDLVEVTNLAGRVPPPLALSLVQVGAETLFMLDESGGRVFSLPLAGGDPEVIFEAGVSYPLLFLFEGPEADAPVGMRWALGAAGPSLTILDANGRLFRFLPGEGVRALEMPNRELIGSPDAVAVDESGIFVLDVAGGSIWRFPQLSDATLLEPQLAIGRTGLAPAGSLAVGDSLYVAGADGRVRRFSDGVDQGFPLLDLDRPLLVPSSLAVGGLTGLVYTVDRGNNRVAVFTPAGELVAQLRADELNGVRGMVPDEANGRLYFVTADALLTSTLPAIIGS